VVAVVGADVEWASENSMCVKLLAATLDSLELILGGVAVTAAVTWGGNSSSYIRFDKLELKLPFMVVFDAPSVFNTARKRTRKRRE